MFHGYLAHDGNKFPRVVMSALTEQCVLFSQGADELHQMFNREQMSSTTIGGCSSQSIYCSHMGACDGLVCSCHNVVTHFLRQENNVDMESYLTDNAAYMKENMKFPYLLILSNKCDVVTVTAYGVNDFHIARLDPGQYFIRDCFISIDNSEELNNPYEQWMNRAIFDDDYGEQLGAVLKSRLRYYAGVNKSPAQGVTLLRSEEFENFNLLTTEIQGLEEGKGCIKGPVSQYNFFSMESRKLIRDDFRSAEMTNNEWNRLVGKRWRELTAAEHEPFRLQAMQDKRRYEAECAAAGIKVEKRVKQTAYNHFVHQEKQFVACTNITNMKHKTGRYCSVRWKAMTPEEKNLYLILEQTGSKN